MFTIQDATAGLALTLQRDPSPRNPRLVEDPLFQIVTWDRELGDPHDWPDAEAFRAVVNAAKHVLYPVVRIETAKGPVMLRKAEAGAGKVIGYAFASHERICIELGIDRITADIRAETMADVEARCLGELQAYDDYVQGEVFCYAIVDRNGSVIETGRDLYGEEYARHVAEQVFNAHLTGVAMDG